MELAPVGEGRGMLGSLVRVTFRGVNGVIAPRTLIAKFASDRQEVLQSALRGGTHRARDRHLPRSPHRLRRSSSDLLRGEHYSERSSAAS